jgi:hypothetical protein
MHQHILLDPLSFPFWGFGLATFLALRLIFRATEYARWRESREIVWRDGTPPLLSWPSLYCDQGLLYPATQTTACDPYHYWRILRTEPMSVVPWFIAGLSVLLQRWPQAGIWFAGGAVWRLAYDHFTRCRPYIGWFSYRVRHSLGKVLWSLCAGLFFAWLSYGFFVVVLGLIALGAMGGESRKKR